ncbi:hypothetical protein [Anatilimnocola floriformis]|nr:hypothetical protein [Anatilimnocola floriformis]
MLALFGIGMIELIILAAVGGLACLIGAIVLVVILMAASKDRRRD